MSRIIIAYNPVRKISNDIIDRFSIAESFFQSQTKQETKIHRSFLLNGNAFISVVFKKIKKIKFLSTQKQDWQFF